MQCQARQACGRLSLHVRYETHYVMITYKLINNVQSMDGLTSKLNAMESPQSYSYYSRQVSCSSVEAQPPPCGHSCRDMNYCKDQLKAQ